MPTTSHGRELSSSAASYPAHGTDVLPGDPMDAWRLYRRTRADALRLKRAMQRQQTEKAQRKLSILTGRILAMRNKIVERELPVLNHVTERLKLSLPRFVDGEDLFLSGVPALISTVERYRPEKGNRFDTFAVPRLRGAILDELRRMDHVPRLARKRNQVKSEAVQAFLKTHGRPPDEQETIAAIQSAGGIDDEKERHRVMIEKPIPGSVSIDTPMRAGRSGDTMTLGEQIPSSDNRNPLNDAQRGDLKRFITEKLDRRERLMLLLYYFENMTMQEVGTTLGISESRVSQSMKSLIRQLQSRMTSRSSELEP
jgi:RNA polymerase sigma factor for flagellar operon FliA